MEAVLHMLIFTSLLFKASALHISGYGNTTAVYGGDAHYRCAVDNPADVMQVTWQRLFGEGSIENMATYSKAYGQQINKPYRSKVIFTEASINSTSITLKNVTWEDESCIICSFNAFPNGSKRKQTCFNVQGISEVYAKHVQVPSSGQKEQEVEVVFSCAATGKPAPTIQWNFTSGATPVEEPQTITVANSDNTLTSSRNITLQVPPYWTGHVDCLVNTGMRGQRQERIPFSGQGKKEENGKSLPRSGIALLIITIIFISCITVAVVMKQKRLKGNRRTQHV